MRHLKTLGLVIVLLIALASSNIAWYFYLNQLPEEGQPKVVVRLCKQYGFHYGQHIIMEHFELIENHSGGKATTEWYTMSGGVTINEAIVAGSLDFASMGIAPAITAVHQGIGTKILLSMGSKEHMLWTWREDIQSIADIKAGDKINLVQVGSIEYVGLVKAFVDLGRTAEDVDDVAVYYKHPDGYQLMEQREIDAHFSGAPYNAMYDADPSYHKISEDTEIWGVPLPGSALIATTKFKEEHPEIFSAVITAWMDATHWIINNEQEAAQIIGEYFEYEDIWQNWQDSALLWNPTFGLSAVKDLADIMYDIGQLDRQMTLEELLFEETLGLIGE